MPTNKNPETHQIPNLKRLPKALAPLTEEKRWVNWRWEQRDNGKWTKPPFRPDDPGKNAKNNDPNTWGEFEKAVWNVNKGKADGLGFCLLGTNIGAIDIDKCCTYNPDTQKYKTEEWARKLCEDANGAYCERTVSGTGRRIIGLADGTDLQRKFKVPDSKFGEIELYRNTARYITVSGKMVGECEELPSIDDFLNILLTRYDGNKARPAERVRKDADHADFDGLIRHGAPEGKRSEPFQRVIWHLAAKGMSAEDIEIKLRRYPNGIAEKYLNPKDRLTEEIERSFAKWEQMAATEPWTTEDFNAYMPAHSYIFRPTGEMWAAASVNARVRSPDADVQTSTWLDRNRPVEQMTWAPGEPADIENKLISGGGWFEREGAKVFNLYRPAVLVGRSGPVKLWRDHLHAIYPKDAEHIERWLAHRVRRPNEKINHALVLGGMQGIGKDTLLEPVKQAIGSWNFHEVSPQQLLGRFNGFLRSVVMRISEARDLGEINRYAFYEHLKAYTAAPPDVLRVDEKHRHEFYIPNIVGIIITTNHKTDGIYLPADDRRHYVAWSEATKEQFDEEYWERLWGWYGEDGIAHMAHHFATLDLSNFNAKAPPPKTNAFWEIVNASRAPEDAELADALDKLGRPPAVTLDDIKKEVGREFHEWLSDRRNTRQIPHRLEECGYIPARNRAADDGLWKVRGRRQAIYARKNLSERERITAARQLAEGRRGTNVVPFRRHIAVNEKE